MNLVSQQGLWTTGGPVAAPPAVAVLEVAGAVLAWTVDDPARPAQLTFTDVSAADWLWRVVGEQGHVAVIDALAGPIAGPHSGIDIADVELSAQALAPLRRLALGHWLRRWWPASVRDGIVDLDIAVLDAELAVLTSAAHDFFAEDTLDSDVEALLRPHREALLRQLHHGDPRVTALVESCQELMDWTESPEPVAASEDRRRDDYALAAGGAPSQPDARVPVSHRSAGVRCLRGSSMPPRTPSNGRCAGTGPARWWPPCERSPAHRPPESRCGYAAPMWSARASSTSVAPRRSAYRCRNRRRGTVIGPKPW